MTDDLLQIDRQLARVEQGRLLREVVSRVDPPAARAAGVRPAVVIAVDRDDVSGGVGPALDVLELDRVGGLPVAGIDQLTAAERVAVEGDHVSIKPALGFRIERDLVGDAFRHAPGLRLSHRPDTEKTDPTLREIIAFFAHPIPRLPRLVE